ncbi:MAG: c-type cytochrome [Edaphobacter sp.]
MKASDSITRMTLVGTGVVGAVIVLGGIAATIHMGMTSIPVHHMLHAGMTLGAGMLAIAMAATLPSRYSERSAWVIWAILAPIFELFLMWPSEYAYLMEHHGLHMLDHAGIIGCSWLAVFAAQAYVRGLGWPMLVLMVLMNAAAAGGFGVAPAPSALLSLPLSTLTAENMGGTSAPGVRATSLHALGEQVAQNMGCGACHKVDGTKSIGPTWKNLAGYPQKLSDGTTAVANYQFLRDAILHPEHLQLEGFPPNRMPTTYGAMLSGPAHSDERDLNAIIWYINSLSDLSTPASQPPVPDALEK